MRSRRQRTRIEHAGLLLAASFLLWGSPALALHPLVVEDTAPAGERAMRLELRWRFPANRWEFKAASQTLPDNDSGASTSSQPVSVLIGAVWSLTRQIELDFGLRRGLNAAASGDAFLIGMAMRW